MSKRFTDTEKYKKKFIRGLPGAYKLFWDYLYHDCDAAGVWHVDFEVAQVYLGQDMLVDEDTAIKLFNQDEKRIEILNDGTKWFIKPFIPFQYDCSVNDLNDQNSAHRGVLKILIKHGVINTNLKPLKRSFKGTNKGLGSTYEGTQDKDKDKDKDKDSIKEEDCKEKPEGKASNHKSTVKKPTQGEFVLPDFIDSETWKSFEEMRNLIKKPMTVRAKELVIIELKKLQKAGNDPKRVLEQSIKNNYQDVYVLKNKQQVQSYETNDPFEKIKKAQEEFERSKNE